MAGAILPQGSLRHSVLCLATAGLLIGCVEGAGTGTQPGQTTAAPAAVRPDNGREVEAPEVFQVAESALWDGRPSLGGIWVASVDVTDPERVVILNPANGKSVNGALFRRERDNPGPPLQVSSDAAEALGMLAGQPTALRVTALRKPVEAAPPPAEDTAVAAAAPTEGVTVPAAGEATAEDSAAAETAALAAAALAATGTAAVVATDAAAAVAEGTVEAAATEAPKPKTWKERRAEAKARREAEKAAKAEAAAAAAGTEIAEGTTGATVEGTGAETAASVDAAAVAAVETAPLDARSPEVAATAEAAASIVAEPLVDPLADPVVEPAPEPAKKTRRQLREEKKAAAEAAAAAEALANAPATEVPVAEASAAEASATEDPDADSASGRPIQVAAYTREANANRAVEALAKIGITGQTLKTETNGKTVWSVTTTGDEAKLNAIKGFGFADAFFLP